jgi:hypothetical protein
VGGALPIGGAAADNSVQITATPSPLIKSNPTILTNIEYTRNPPSVSGVYQFPLISKANSDRTPNHKFLNTNHFIFGFI